MLKSYYEESTVKQHQRIVAVSEAINIVKLIVQSTSNMKAKDMDSVLDCISDNIGFLADSIQDAIEHKHHE